MISISKTLQRAATIGCAALLCVAFGGVAQAQPTPQAAHPVLMAQRTPVSPPVISARRAPAIIAIRADFRLQFKDAYLVYEPHPSGPGTLQITAELNVLSYGTDWTVSRLKPYLFHLKLNSWSGFFWMVNTSRHEIFRVTGVSFGSLGGTQTPVPSVTVDTVGDPNNPTRFLLRFGNAYLIKPQLGSHPSIYASNTILSHGADWTVTKDSALSWVYHLKESVWKGFSWKVNLHRQRAYRVRDPLDPCGTDVRLKADVYAPASVTGGPNVYDVFGCTWAAVARPEGMPYPSASPLANLPDNEVIGKDVATATTPATMTKITIRNAANNAVIASSPSSAYLGDYDIRFTSSAASRSVVFEVARLDTGDVLYRSPTVTLAKGDNPREILLAGAEGDVISGIPFPSGTNTGLFTRVGNVELADIDSKGFAKFTGSAAQWRDAPFGGRLDLFGAFTSNFYPATGNGQYCYKLRITPPSGPAYYATDALYKTRYVVLNNGHVQSQSISLGPVHGCYLLTPTSGAPQPGDPPGAVAVFWSYPDLFGRWHTDSRNGAYTVKLELYHMNPNRTVGALVPILVNDNTTAELYLDNTPVRISFDRLQVSGGGPNLLVNACAIANLMNGRTLSIDFTAEHPNGYLSSYSLAAQSNSGVTVWSESGAYAAPSWSGAHPTLFYGRRASALPFTKTAAAFSAGPCAYILDLTAWARTTNGYYHFNWRHARKFYYIQP